MKKTYLLAMILFLLSAFFASGCKAIRESAVISEHSESDMTREMTRNDNEQLNEELVNSLRILIDQKGLLTINHRLYDTDKPADPATGLHPVAEEVEVTLDMETSAMIDRREYRELEASNESLSSDKKEAYASDSRREETTREVEPISYRKEGIAVLVIILLLAGATVWYRIKK